MAMATRRARGPATTFGARRSCPSVAVEPPGDRNPLSNPFAVGAGRLG
jgi:hypothetical protein